MKDGNIDLFLREEFNKTLYIMPLTEKSMTEFKDQLDVLLIIIKDMKDLSKKISVSMEKELSDTENSIKAAILSENLFFSINLDLFKKVHVIFRDSFLNETIIFASKEKVDNIELVYLNKINEIFINLITGE